MPSPTSTGVAAQDPNAQPSTTQDISALLGLGGNAYGLYNSINLAQEANTAIGQANPFGAYRPQYAAQLSALMANPSSITSQPGYQFLLGQGVQAIDRSAAAPGGTGFGSGAEGTALETYGQGLADQFYQQQVQTLSGLAGANITPSNAVSGITAAGGAAGSIGSSITGLGSSLNLLSKLFPGVSSSSQPGQAGYDAALVGAPNQGVINAQNNPSVYDTSTSNPVMSTDPGDTSGGGGPDLSGIFSNPNAAGGEAATSSANSPMFSNTGQLLSNAGGAASVISGIASGSPTGYAQAAISGTTLAARNPSVTGLSPQTSGQVGNLAGEAGNLLGIYSGLREGGGLGDTSAAVNAASLATKVGYLGGPAGTAASALGPVGDVLGIISGIKTGGAAGYGGAALDAYNLYNSAGVIGQIINGTLPSAEAVAADAAAGSATSTAGGGAAAAGSGIGSAALGALAPLSIIGLGILSSNTKEDVSQYAKATPGVNVTANLASVGALGAELGTHDYHTDTSDYTINGKPLSNAASTAIAQYSEYAGTKGASSLTYDPTANKISATGIAAPEDASTSWGIQSQVKQNQAVTANPLSAYSSPSQIGVDMSAVYNEYGGQKGWGVSFNDWLKQINLLSSSLVG